MKYFIILFLGCITIPSFSQLTLERQVIGAAGLEGLSGQISVDMTLGEPVTQTFTQGTLVLTQGFHQSGTSGSVSIDPTIGVSLQYHVFPNPTSDKVTVRFQGVEKRNISLSLIDYTGRNVLLEMPLVFESGTFTTDMDLSPLASGIYRLVVRQGENHTLAAIPIQRL